MAQMSLFGVVVKCILKAVAVAFTVIREVNHHLRFVFVSNQLSIEENGPYPSIYDPCFVTGYQDMF